MGEPVWKLTYSQEGISWRQVEKFLTGASVPGWVRFALGVAAAMVVFAYVIWIGEALNTEPDLIAAKVIPIVVLSIGLVGFMLLSSTIRNKRTTAEAKVRARSGSVTLTMDETGVTWATDNASSRITWAAIHDVTTWPGGALIRFHPWTGLPIPAAAFKTAAEMNRFIDDAKLHLSAHVGTRS